MEVGHVSPARPQMRIYRSFSKTKETFFGITSLMSLTKYELLSGTVKEVVAKIFHRSATRCTKSNSTKQHSWQIVSNGNAVNYRWLFFSARFGEKKLKFGHCQNIQWSIASENLIWSLLVNNHILYEKNTVKSTPWLQEQQTAADTHDMSSQSTLFQAGQTPPAEPICCCVASSLSPEDLGVRVYVRVCALHCGPKLFLFRGSDETQLITDASDKW